MRIIGMTQGGICWGISLYQALETALQGGVEWPVIQGENYYFSQRLETS